MQHLEGVGVFHPTSSWTATPLQVLPCRSTGLAGSTCWSWPSSSVEGGKLTSPVPDYSGQSSEVRNSHTDKTLGEENKPGQEEKVKGEAAALLRALFACCCTRYQCPSVPLTPGKGVAVSLAPSIWAHPAIQKGKKESGTCSMCWPSHGKLGCLLL